MKKEQQSQAANDGHWACAQTQLRSARGKRVLEFALLFIALLLALMEEPIWLVPVPVLAPIPVPAVPVLLVWLVVVGEEVPLRVALVLAEGELGVLLSGVTAF